MSKSPHETGISVASGNTNANPAPVKHGEYSQASRALALGSYFLSGIMAVNASQFLGAPLYLINREWYNTWIAFTKQSFGLLTTTLTQCWAPTVIKVSGDSSMRGQLLQTTDGGLVCDFPERLVLIANHQIYTDWLYLWFIAYANGMHGRLYIFLKESLKRIPIIGWGMQFSQFIFVKRNWEQDKPNFARHLHKLRKPTEPMWLLMFPEGTVVCGDTKKKSKKWADKNGIPDMQHQLLPHSRGLQFCLQELRESVEYLYDCTIGYEGVPRGEFALDIFTLKAQYLEGRPPKSVSMYFRRFKISNIPIDDDKAFELWLRAHWTAKDKLLEGFVRTGRFPADTASGQVATEIKATKWYEFMQIFAPVGLIALVLYAFYGSLPKKIVKSLNRENVRKKVESVQRAAAEPAKLLAAAPNMLKAVQKLPIAPLLRALSAKELPIAAAIKALSEKDLIVGQVPVGLVLKAVAQNNLPITTIHSILKALSDRGHLKGAMPNFPERKLLNGSAVSTIKPKQAVAVPKVAARSSVAQKPPANGALKPINAVKIVAPKPTGNTSLIKAQSGPVTKQTAASNSMTPAKKMVTTQNPAPAQTPAPNSSSAITTKKAPAKPSAGSQSLTKAISTPAVPKQATSSKPPTISQKPVTIHKPNGKANSTSASKSTAPKKPVVVAKPVSKTLGLQKTPLKELTNSNNKTPPSQVTKAQATAAPTTKTPSTKAPKTSAPNKSNPTQKPVTNPPKLEPAKLAAKPKIATSQAKPPNKQGPNQILKKSAVQIPTK